MESITPFSTSDFIGGLEKFSPIVKDIRKKFLFTLVFFAFSTLAGFIFYEDIIKFFIGTLSLQGVNIVFTSPFQFINLAISCGATTGIVLTIPLAVYQTLRFLKPALNRKEFSLVTRLLPFSLLLFVIGFVFGSAIMKWQIEIFLNKSVTLGIGNILDITGLLSTVFITSVLMGFGFQFPIIMLLLLRIGVIKAQHLSKIRKWIYLVFLIFVFFLPPDSLLVDILLVLPFIGLFELIFVVNFLYQKRK